MTNYFNFNNMFSMDMSNWFMSNWSFPNYFASFQMPSFNIFDSFSCPLNYQANQPFLNSFDYNIFSSNTKPKINSDVVSKNTDTFTRSSTINYAKDDLKLDGYNAFKGERLANTALNRSVGWTGFCAAYVKSDIQAAGLGSYKYGHAYQMPRILKNNPNFKEISPEGVDVSKLPAGCILVYGKGVEGYNKKYGHTEITTGDGRAVSDGITNNLYKKPSSIFIPV